MDELKIRTGFAKFLISKAISKLISSKTGCDFNIVVDELEMVTEGEDVRVELKVRGNAKKLEVEKALKGVIF